MTEAMTESMTDLDRFTEPILAGDTRAFGDFMASAEPVVRKSLRSFAARVDTESVVQETFLRVWQVAPRFRADGKPNGLLRLALRIARNLAISETRRLRGKAMPTPDGDELERSPAMGVEELMPRPPDPFLRRLIEGCRERLPTRPAQALAERLASRGGDSDLVLAERLGMSKNTFLQNFTRARRFLARCLKEEGVDIEALQA